MMFFSQFQKRCKALGTSPTAIAVKAGVNRSNVTFWKNGSTPNGDILLKLANELNCSVDYLLGLTDDPTHPNTKGDTQWTYERVDFELNKLLKNYPDKNFTDSQIESISNIMRELIQNSIDADVGKT